MRFYALDCRRALVLVSGSLLDQRLSHPLRRHCRCCPISRRVPLVVVFALLYTPSGLCFAGDQLFVAFLGVALSVDLLCVPLGCVELRLRSTRWVAQFHLPPYIWHDAVRTCHVRRFCQVAVKFARRLCGCVCAARAAWLPLRHCVVPATVCARPCDTMGYMIACHTRYTSL